MPRYFTPKYVRELAEDIDYLDKLPPKEREWMERFLDEYYNATDHGISEEDHLAESNRARQRARRDLFAYGLRNVDLFGGVRDEFPSPTLEVSGDLERPEVLAILERLRELRPGFDDADGRRRARFVSTKAEREFYKLRAKLAALLGREVSDE